jgi:signal transduction histidine kinase
MSLDKLRLKWKIFAFLLGFCALLLVVLWMMQTVFISDIYQFIRKQELTQAIKLVEKEIDNPDLQEIIINIQIESDIIIALTPEFAPPQRPGGVVSGRRNGLDSLTEVKEFTLNNGQTVSLTFYVLIIPVNATVTTLRYQLYFISGIMLLLAVGLAIVIARRVSKPIEDINRGARILSKGNYDTRFAGKGFQEIVELSETLNTAAVELGRVEKLRRELLANVSHDLRTPLSLIYSYAEMMNDFPGEITQEQTKVIMYEIKRLTTLVNDVLDISKLENEMEHLTVTRFNLTRSIGETVERVQELLKNEGFDIAFTYCDDVFVNADETKINRIFYNLLINAVNYSGDSRVIAAMQTVSGSRVRISVTDEGEGIGSDDLPFIWDRYYKSSKKHKRAVTGTGLGLTIVKRIVELHGGSYGVTSEVDKGSTFWFEINVI